jgi:hypothetical protein
MRKAISNLALSAILIVACITTATLFLTAQPGAPMNCVDLNGCTGNKGCVAYYWESAPDCKIWCYAVPPEGKPGTIQCAIIDP